MMTKLGGSGPLWNRASTGCSPFLDAGFDIQVMVLSFLDVRDIANLRETGRWVKDIIDKERTTVIAAIIAKRYAREASFFPPNGGFTRTHIPAEVSFAGPHPQEVCNHRGIVWPVRRGRRFLGPSTPRVCRHVLRSDSYSYVQFLEHRVATLRGMQATLVEAYKILPADKDDSGGDDEVYQDLLLTWNFLDTGKPCKGFAYLATLKPEQRVRINDFIDRVAEAYVCTNPMEKTIWWSYLNEYSRSGLYTELRQIGTLPWIARCVLMQPHAGGFARLFVDNWDNRNASSTEHFQRVRYSWQGDQTDGTMRIVFPPKTPIGQSQRLLRSLKLAKEQIEAQETPKQNFAVFKRGVYQLRPHELGDS